jgi:hypothetical protein
MRHEEPYANNPVSPGASLEALKQEWLARRHAGQACELWDVNGGADAVCGFTVLWMPEEHVCWAFHTGQEPTWYFSPCSRALTFQVLAHWETQHYLTRLKGYVHVSRRGARQTETAPRPVGVTSIQSSGHPSLRIPTLPQRPGLPQPSPLRSGTGRHRASHLPSLSPQHLLIARRNRQIVNSVPDSLQLFYANFTVPL